LGSVESFPQRRRASGSSAAWKVASLRNGTPKVRAARLEDYAAIRALQRRLGSDAQPSTLKQFESQLRAFPEGQLVASADGELLGASSSFVIQWDDYADEPTWKKISGDGYFTTHDSAGRTLYGSEIAADSEHRGFSAGRALHQARRRLCRKLNLRRIIGASRLPGYGAVSGAMSPEAYAKRVIWGDIDDPVLRFEMSQGFHYCGIIHGYRVEDAESCGHAALFVWLNPLYSPPEPSAFANSERPRKCA
jgi:GNAT superfamily N-acetyltransferase